jgi:molecular chaperone HscB
MICWSCEKSAGGGVFCVACGALQPPNPGADHFEVLGVERRYDLDLVDLEGRYKDLARKLHPDRFTRADARARRFSLSRSVQLNEAWKTLRDPRRRGEYLLALHGIEVAAEEGIRRGPVDGGKERVPVAQDLLLEVMALREGLMEARLEGDEGQVAALAADVRRRRASAMEAVAAALDRRPWDLDQAARQLVAVRYYDRFFEEVAAHEEGEAARAAAEVDHAG